MMEHAGNEAMKTPEDYFSDWEAHVFGFGYGTGEEHIVPSLKTLFGAFGNENGPSSYDYQKLELSVGPVAAWLFINALCHANILEYGTSPRFGRITPHGERLKAFIDSKSADELMAMTCRDQDYWHCSPDACNCGPEGYEAGRKCGNQFWIEW